jgi:hypothetical protein
MPGRNGGPRAFALFATFVSSLGNGAFAVAGSELLRRGGSGHRVVYQAGGVSTAELANGQWPKLLRWLNG